MNYGTTDAAGRGVGVRYDLATQTARTSAPTPAGWGIIYAVNVAVDRKGNFWTPTQLGNVMFSFNGAAPIRYAERAAGAVVTGGGALVRLSHATFSVLTPAGFVDTPANPSSTSPGALLTLNVVSGPLPGSVASSDPSTPDAFWTSVTGDGATYSVRRYSVSARAQDKPDLLLGSAASGDSEDFSVAPDGTIANIVSPVAPDSHPPAPADSDQLARFSPTGARQLTPVPRSHNGPIYDSTGALWLMSGATPQVFVLRPDGSLVNILLTSATDPTSSDYLAHLPFAMRLRPDGAIVVMTFAREILLIRRN